MFRPLPITVFARLDIDRQHFAPGEPQSFEDGLALLRRMAPDVPIHILRLERGLPMRAVRDAPIRPTELTPQALLPGVTAFAAAFEDDQGAHLVVASRSPLQRPAADGRDYPRVWGATEVVRDAQRPLPASPPRKKRPRQAP